MTEQHKKIDSTTAEPPGSALLRVLIVEDREEDAVLLAAQLARAGCRITHQRVDTAAAMKDALLAAEWDIVISDHVMPGFSSSSALQVLHQSGRNIPLIIYSGCISDQAAEEARRDGAQNCITKGHFGELVPALEQALGSTGVAVGPGDGNLLRLAEYDRVTGLPGRALFMRRAARHLASIRDGEHVAFCFIDFARLGRVNQTLGDAATDQVLAQIARRLRAGTKETLVSRLEGDRFVLVRGGFSTLQAVQVFAQQTIDMLAECSAHGGVQLQLASSMGVSVAPEDGSVPDELMRHAETAMFHCRQLLGRNGFLFYFRGMEEDSGRSAMLGSTTRAQLQLAYQPVIALDSGAVVAMAALARWQHPELGLISPERLAALVDDPGATGRAGEWVLREACRHAAAWHAAGNAGLAVLVNISASRFRQTSLPARLSRILGDARIDPRCVILEVAESALMRDAEAALHTLQVLKRTGVRIAIDDFGIGCSSLGYLKRYPVDVLKIDRSFVAGIASDARDAAIARAIIDIGRSLGLSVLAEGVETGEQAACLREYGCSSAQGFFFSAPIAAADVPGFVACRPVDNSGPAEPR
jgi:diguanylate cyclase (GGDEF)-like protein